MSGHSQHAPRPSQGSVTAGALPVPLAPLVGREREVAAVRDLLLQPHVRLVTLLGPGGVGKTRLAIAVASALQRTSGHAVTFIPLAPIREPSLVTITIARILGLRQTGDRPLAEALAAAMSGRDHLLVLDNFEQVLPAAPVLAELLAVCPALTLLVTSRVVLHLSGEHIFLVPPLALPDPTHLPPLDEVARYSAVQLFVERAWAAQQTFALTTENAAAVVGICARLDGLPLAIELAAARSTMLPPQAILARLAHRLPLLIGGVRDLPARLQTMRDAIAWSYDLLSPAEQALLQRLAVFAGGCPLEAVETVCAGTSLVGAGLESLAALVDGSWLHPVEQANGAPRFVMLETLREYALDHLAASGTEASVRRAHARYMQGLAEAAEPGLRGSEQQRWWDRIEAELDNLREALMWSLAAMDKRDAEAGLRIAGALWYFWLHRGFPEEGRRWLTWALNVAPGIGPLRARALHGAGTLAWRQGDYTAAAAALAECVTIWRALADSSGLGTALHILGHIQFDRRDYATARALFGESRECYEKAGDVLGGLPLVSDLGMVAYHEGDYAAAGTIFTQSLDLYRRYGLKDRVADTLNRLGDLARLAKDEVRAAALYEESLALWRELRSTPGIASGLHKLGQVRRQRREWAGAGALLAESLALQQELGNKQGIAECLAGLAGIAGAVGQPERAAQVLAATVALLAAIGAPLAPADQTAFEGDVAQARAQQDEMAWARAWAAGQTMTLEKAIATALTIRTEQASTPIPPSIDALGEHRSFPLSRREREVAALITQGRSNREIAAALTITEKTAANHVAHIMTKLDLRSRTQIAVWAVAHDLDDASPG